MFSAARNRTVTFLAPFHHIVESPSMSLLSLSPSPLSYVSGSKPNSSAEQTLQQSNLKTAYAAASSQGAGRPCTSCQLTVTLNANSVCNACFAMKKVRAREGKRKRKSVPAPSAARKSLPMVSTDIGGESFRVLDILGALFDAIRWSDLYRHCQGLGRRRVFSDSNLERK